MNPIWLLWEKRSAPIIPVGARVITSADFQRTRVTVESFRRQITTAGEFVRVIVREQK